MIIRRHTLTAAALAAAAVLAGATGCATPSTTALGAAPVVQPALPAADLTFVAAAAGSGLFEAEAGRLAAARGQHAGVRSYGQMLVDHHALANQELMALARTRNVAVATTMPAPYAERLQALSRLSGEAFDREFVRMAGLQAHQTAIGLFEQGQRDVRDPALHGWIGKTLPVLRTHLQHAQALAGQLVG